MTDHLLSLIDRLETELVAAALNRFLQELLNHFKCDRAWCLYPCDPESDFWRVPFEKTRYEWPGANDLNIPMPTDDGMRAAFNELLAAKQPVTFGKYSDLPVPEPTVKAFRVRAQLVNVIYPTSGKPWLLGVHYCEEDHQFSEDNIETFRVISEKLAKIDRLTQVLERGALPDQ